MTYDDRFTALTLSDTRQTLSERDVFSCLMSFNFFPYSRSFSESVLLHINRSVGFSSCCTVLITSNPHILLAAEKVTGNLAQLTSQVTPGDVCSVYGIRKAMGISLPIHTAQDSFIHLTTGNTEQEIFSTFGFVFYEFL